MSRIRAAVRRLVAGITWAPRRLRSWWNELEAPERVLYRGIGFVAIGLAPWSVQASAIFAGVVLLLFFFDFSLRRGT